MPVSVVACPECGETVRVSYADGGASCPKCRCALPNPHEETRTTAAKDDSTRQIPDARAGSRRAQRMAASGSRREPELTDDGEVLPRRLRQYELLEVLGRGGMGVVYRARHVGLDRMVALKLIKGADPAQADALRFVAEAQVTGQIEHPNIVPVHELGTDEQGRPYFVMKIVRGRSLSQILTDLHKGDAEAHRQYSLHRLLQIFGEVCQAVAFAHAKGVLHRDLKPSNVMIGDFGEVMLMDWGLAKKFGKPETQTAGLLAYVTGQGERRVPSDGLEVKTVRDDRAALDSQPGLVAGTPEYMSPEQATGDPEALSPRSDVYSLGAMLFEILCYRPPHIDPDTRMLLRKIVHERPYFPQPGGFRPKVPKALKAVTMKALEAEPAKRYGNALELLKDVRAVVEDRPVAACPDTVFDRALRVGRRHGPVLVTVALALVLLSMGAAVAFWRLEAVAKEKTEEIDRNYQLLVEKNLAEQKARVESENAAEARRNELEALKKQKHTESDLIEHRNRLVRSVPEFLDALQMLERRQYSMALDRLQAVIYVDPYSPVAQLAYFYRGEVFSRKGTPQAGRDAILAFEEADKLARMSNHLGDARALLRCGDVAWKLLDEEREALKYYNQAAAINPTDAYSLLGKAYAHLLNGRAHAEKPETVKAEARAALEIAEQITRTHDILWEARRLAGNLYAGVDLPQSGLADLQKAYAHFTRAVELNPDVAEIWLNRARISRELDRQGLAERKIDALSDYLNALRLAPDNVDALLGRGELLLELNRPEEALRYLDQAAPLAPQNGQVALHRGLALKAIKRLPEAEAAFGDALRLRPSVAAAWLERARVRFEAGRFAEAAADAEQAGRLEPGNNEVQRLHADALLKTGDAARAAENFRELAKQGSAEALRKLGQALLEQSKDGEAIGAFLEYLKQAPERQEVRLKVVELCLQDPKDAWYDPAKAVTQAKEALGYADDKEDLDLLLALGRAHLAAGLHAEAKAYAESAYTKAPWDERVNALRKRVLEALPAEKPGKGGEKGKP